MRSPSPKKCPPMLKAHNERERRREAALTELTIGEAATGAERVLS